LNIDQDGNLFVAHNDVQKAEALHDFFASVLYIQESREVFDTLPTRWKINDMELLSVVEARDVNFGFVQKSIIVLKKWDFFSIIEFGRRSPWVSAKHAGTPWHTPGQ